MVLELSAHRIEATANCNINVFMGLVLGRIALLHDLSTRNLQTDANMIKASLTVTPIECLDHDTTADNAIIELLEFLNTLADLRRVLRSSTEWPFARGSLLGPMTALGGRYAAWSD